jgi:hypothetical protein
MLEVDGTGILFDTKLLSAFPAEVFLSRLNAAIESSRAGLYDLLW